MDSSTLFGISTMAYIFAMIAYMAYLAFKKSPIGITATILTILGFTAQTSSIVMRWVEFNERYHLGFLRSAPFTNLYESLSFFVWCLILGYLLIEFRYKNRSFGAFVTPIAGLALAFIDLTGMSKEIQPLVPALQSNWLLAHVIMSFIAYSTFAIAFSTGLIYLILKTDKRNESSYIFWTVSLGVFIAVLFAMGLDYLTVKTAVKNHESFIRSNLFKATFLNPSNLVKIVSWIAASAFIYLLWRFGYLLKKAISAFSISTEALDEITYKSIATGFPVFTIGGLIFGAIWADQAWGVYWSWDPKETWSLISWLTYAFYLHARVLRGWKGKKIAAVAVVGFIVVIFTYLGVNMLLSGLHSYGSG